MPASQVVSNSAQRLQAHAAGVCALVGHARRERGRGRGGAVAQRILAGQRHAARTKGASLLGSGGATAGASVLGLGSVAVARARCCSLCAHWWSVTARLCLCGQVTPALVFRLAPLALCPGTAPSIGRRGCQCRARRRRAAGGGGGGARDRRGAHGRRLTSAATP